MTKRLSTTLAATLFLAVSAQTARASEITADGSRLAAVLDSMGVESRWPAGLHVAWESGLPDGRPESGPGKHTHCSAFVASAAKRLGVYILRPPEHTQVHLANAQFDWLGDEGTRQEWRPVADAEEAQRLANQGWLVVAAYRSHSDSKPGHIAIVRPSEKSRSALRAEGPQVIQAGGTNYASTSLERGFAGHPGAWGRHEVRFWAHRTVLPEDVDR